MTPATELVAPANDLWCVLEKIDGRRVLIQSAGDKVVAVNRKGLAISLPTPIIVDVTGIPGDFTLDGECVGDVCHAFDLLERDGENLRPFPLNRRLVELLNVFASAQHTNVRLVETAYDTGAKQGLYDALKEANKEGVVLKFLLAPYTAGRPNSGGAAYLLAGRFVEQPFEAPAPSEWPPGDHHRIQQRQADVGGDGQ
jgi:bifunctional non-homologous end joining protein LigD